MQAPTVLLECTLGFRGVGFDGLSLGVERFRVQGSG